MKVEEKVKYINGIICNESWLDMEVIGMNGGDIRVACSRDFTYGHFLELIFKDVFYLCLNMEWKTDTSKTVLRILNNNKSYELNKKFRIEQGNLLFEISTEDLSEPFYVAAKDFEYNEDRVLYYKKDNLEENERIADWV